jgi:hypothetical protein
LTAFCGRAAPYNGSVLSDNYQPPRTLPGTTGYSNEAAACSTTASLR